MITVDIRKAFDCVRTDNTLQNKIKYFTKSDSITDWINSYYKDRKQFTKWGSKDSKIVKNHEISIVQGSNIGSKMFNFYINDLSSITNQNDVKICLFADDCSILSANSKTENLEKEVNDELLNIKDYFDSNFLSINIQKTKFLHFKPTNKNQQKIRLKIGSEEIEEKQSLTYLGLIIDNKLNFKEHFEKIYSKIKNGLNGLIMTKNQLNYKTKLIIYHSLIHSHLSYCAIIWINKITKKQLNKLKVTQKKAIRIIHGARYNAHTDELFQKSNITKVENIFAKQSLILAYKFQQKKLPNAIQELFDKSLQNDSRFTRFSASSKLKIDSSLKNDQIMYEIINNWNSANKSLREEENFKAFKRKIMEIQNSFDKCNVRNCFSCRQN